MTHVRRIAVPALLAHRFEEVFMSHKPFSAILLAFALFTCSAFAQNAPAQNNARPAPLAAPATNKTDALTPEQAKQALDTLQDDKKRAQMIDTLRAIANASPQPQAGEHKSAIPLAADSLGAELLLT